MLKWEDPHDSVVYCVDSDNKWMVISGTNRYGVVRFILIDMRERARLYILHVLACSHFSEGYACLLELCTSKSTDSHQYFYLFSDAPKTGITGITFGRF